MKNDSDYEILFEDKDIVVINKPAGILTIPDRYERRIKCLSSVLREIYPGLLIVHRLDKDTSGVIIFAKNPDSHRKLNIRFMEQKVRKIYHAVVAGNIRQDELRIDIPIAPDSSAIGLSKPSAKGKESLSLIRVMERFRHATLIEVDLVSGRHHQLRVHCAAIGHPLLIDEDYGSSGEFFVSSIKRKYNLKKHTEEKPVISRLSMHARTMEFEHPSTGIHVSYTAEYPRDFKALLQVLRKYSKISVFQNFLTDKLEI